MKISLNWLKRFIDLKKSPKEISDILTETGLEVDTIEDYQIQKSKIDNLVIGEIKSLLKHPNSENLQIAKVNIGEKKRIKHNKANKNALGWFPSLFLNMFLFNATKAQPLIRRA